MKIKTFNTERSYTANGQRIGWVVVGNQTHFSDIDRMVCGTIDRVCEANHQVLYYYDQNLYAHLNDYEIRNLIEAEANKI